MYADPLNISLTTTNVNNDHICVSCKFKQSGNQTVNYHAKSQIKDEEFKLHRQISPNSRYFQIQKAVKQKIIKIY